MKNERTYAGWKAYKGRDEGRDGGRDERRKDGRSKEYEGRKEIQRMEGI